MALAAAAIDAYQRGSVVADRYRGRAGQPQAEQEAEYARLAEGGALPLACLLADFDDGRAGVKRGLAGVRTAVWGWLATCRSRR